MPPRRGIVLLAGLPGLGKTYLCRELLVREGDAADVQYVHVCYDREYQRLVAEREGEGEGEGEGERGGEREDGIDTVDLWHRARKGVYQ
ncbi:hypothetical protein KIPB_009625, partial [Kipferlia bialata]|eukprot:g9625.t1